MPSNSIPSGQSPSRLRRLGRQLINFRFLFLALVFVFVYAFGELGKSYPEWLILLPISAFAFNGVIYLLSFFFGGSRFFLYFQLLFDLAFVSVLVFYTGGSESNFVFLYYANVIAAAIITVDNTVYIFASVATITIAAKAIADSIEQRQISTYMPFVVMFAQFSGLFLTAIIFNNRSRELEEMSVYNEETLENISDAIIVIAPNKDIAFINPAAKSLLALSDKDVRRKFSAVFSKPGLKELGEEIAMRDENDSFEIDIEPFSGYILPVNVRISHLSGRGPKGIGKVVLIEDLTTRRRMQEMETRERRMQEFALVSAGVAHEIRNPLASIKSAAQVLQQEAPDEDLRNMADIITKESNRLDTILSDFLHLTRMRTPTLSSVPLRPICLDVKATVCASSNCIGYDIDVPEKLNCNVDKEQFTQVLLNLSLNSVQSNPTGVNIKISAVRMNQNEFLRKHKHVTAGFGGYFRFGVVITHEDDGIGVPKDVRDDIFVPFFTTRPKGTGLGLAIVQRIIASHNGMIIVDFDREKGVAFQIWLPIIASTEGV